MDVRQIVIAFYLQQGGLLNRAPGYRNVIPGLVPELAMRCFILGKHKDYSYWCQAVYLLWWSCLKGLQTEPPKKCFAFVWIDTHYEV